MCRVASAAVRVCGWQGVEGGLEWGCGGLSGTKLFLFSLLPLLDSSAKMAFYFPSMLLLPLKSYFC